MTAGSPAEILARHRQLLTAPGTLFEVVDENVRGNTMPVFRHRARTLPELLDRSARFADRPYMADGDRRFSFGEHLAMVDAFAAALQQEHALKPGDRVALYAANRWEWVVAYWALLRVGAIPALFNGWWTADEFAHGANLTSPVLVLGDRRCLERAAASAIELPTFDLDDLDSAASTYGDRRPNAPAGDEDDTAVLFFTSGTTGRPKAVNVPHRALIGFVQLSTLGDATGRLAMGGAVPLVGDELPPSDDVVLVTSPLFHTSMLNGVVKLSMITGSSFVLLPGRFDPERVLATIERERVTRWLALGSAGPRVAASPAVGRYDTSSVRYLGIGGAPVSPSVQDALRAAFPSRDNPTGMGMGYTSTEGGAVVAHIAGPELVAHPTSTGRVTVTTQIELRDDDGKPVREGHYGEVHVRSPYLMLGYWNDPDASAAVLKPGGWLAMGDIARLEDGLLYIDSRARDMILVSAENVSPNEVEYCLEAHAAIREAAVFAVDDPITGDAVCAVVHVAPGSDVTTSQLTEWCLAHLAHYKVPTHWRLVSEPLPRTASGKLMKHILREQATTTST